MIGRTAAAECRENQMRQLAFLAGWPVATETNSAMNCDFIDVQAAAFAIGESPRADFGGAAVVDDAGAPGRFDPPARGGDAAARLAGDDDLFDGRSGQIDFVFGGDFGEPQRVGGRAADGGHSGVLRISSMRARLPSPPPGTTSAPRATSASNALQKPTKGPKENASRRDRLGVTSAASSTYCQASIHHCQSSAVSTTTSGRPRVPDVWWQRT